MTKKDFELIAGAFAESERFNESLGADTDGLTASTLRILADDIAGRIARDHPRFNTGTFIAACFPRAEERKKQAIIAALARSKEGRA